MTCQPGMMIEQRTSFGEALVEIGAEDRRVMVLDGDVCTSTQTCLFRDAYPERFYQIGIAEQNMVGIAAGMSAAGLVPWVSTFAVFLVHRAGDQVRNAVALPRANVKLNGAYAGLPTGRAGGSHASVEDVAVMRALPHMTVLEPADAVETRLLTRLATQMQGPVYLRTVRCAVPVLFPTDHTVTLGKAVPMREGMDATVFSTGMMTARAKVAVEMLSQRGLSLRHVHFHTLKPIDQGAILQACQMKKTIFTVENHSVIGGLGSAVAEFASQIEPCRVIRIGYQDIFLESGNDEELFDQYGLTAQSIAARIENELRP
jgi:transketolase